MEDVAAWAKRTGVGQAHLWQGNRAMPSEDDEEGRATASSEPEVTDLRPEDQRILRVALQRFFGAIDGKYDTDARLEALMLLNAASES